MPSGMPSPKLNPCYFLISVSTAKNLELCIRYDLAGFPGGEGGAWTFCEIAEGDFVSFLYGARAHNLYKVQKRQALCDAEHLPPQWQPVQSQKSDRVYHFPFRLHLQQIRIFDEPLVRPEFTYIAENLLQRGGYGKTHFQADQTTLQSVSGMGTVAKDLPATLELPKHTEFTVRFSRTTSLTKPPEIVRFKEPILQSAIRRHLMSEGNLQVLLNHVDLKEIQADALEILGEKGLPEGHIDLLLKERVPLGSALKIPIEVKTNVAGLKDLTQLHGYISQLHGECPIGVLVAADFNKKAIAQAPANRIRLVRYALNIDLKKTPTFEEIYQSLTLEPLGK